MANGNWNDLKIVKRNNEKGFESIKNIIQTKKNTKCELFDSLIGKHANYTKEDWFNHNFAYYGTKRDVPFDEIFKLEVDNEYIHLSFESDCVPPIGFAEKLCKQYEVGCELKYYEAADDFAGCFRANEHGGFDDRRSTLEGWYVYDRDMFWDNLEFMYELRYSEIDEFINSISYFVCSDDLKKVKSYLEE